MYSGILVSLALAATMHLDWHLARPTTHHLSLGWAWHWLFAIPAFVPVALYVTRVWTARVRRASVAIIGSATVLAGVLEPAWEYWLADVSWEWAFGATRNHALGTFLATGLLAYVVTVVLVKPRRPSPGAG